MAMKACRRRLHNLKIKQLKRHAGRFCFFFGLGENNLVLLVPVSKKSKNVQSNKDRKLYSSFHFVMFEFQFMSFT